jgi:hypothetical protein
LDNTSLQKEMDDTFIHREKKGGDVVSHVSS